MSVTPTSPDSIIPRLKAETLSTLIKKGVRADGRGLEDFRELKIITNYLPKADGSALVKLGDTQVLVGVKLELGSPYPDTPEEGVLVVSAEFVPTASPAFEPGPPDENAIELARVIDRVLREYGVIDVSKLVIVPGRRVWVVWIDIYVLDHGGNLIDASAIATLAALLTTKIPKYTVTENELIQVDKSSRVDSLPVVKKALTVTVGKLGDSLIVDPTIEEEKVMTAKLVVGVGEDGSIAGLQKSGDGYLKLQEVEKAIELALRKGSELLSKVTEFLKTLEVVSTESTRTPSVSEERSSGSNSNA
ncbi:MAG: exosome complex protein Rrp42 [Desulfurococcaceae archaeon TW002]